MSDYITLQGSDVPEYFGLIVAGVKKRKQSSDTPAEEEAASVVLVPGVRGVTLVGRF